MASRTRGQKVKSDVMTLLLQRIPIEQLLPKDKGNDHPRFDSLCYEMLYQLDFQKQTPMRQLWLINFVTVYCNLLYAQTKGDYEGSRVLQNQLATVQKVLNEGKGKQDVVDTSFQDEASAILEGKNDGA